jgi:hypothetical protein
VKTFVQNHRRDVIGVLNGFDRLVLRGTIRQLAHVEGMTSYLAARGILLKDFGAHCLQMSELMKNGLMGAVKQLGRPVEYLQSSTVRKEDVARELALRDGIGTGSIALLTCVEPCRSYKVYRNREKRRLELRLRGRKCLFLYHYFSDPMFGFMHARIQTWFPFSIQVCLNGREWLARQMERAGMNFRRRDNCFVWLEDVERAQRLMDRQLRVNWPRLLDRIACAMNPAQREMFGPFRTPYYWSVYQSEWASDVMFHDPAALTRIYPRLVLHGMRSFSSPDVLRFLGRKVPLSGPAHHSFKGQIVSDLKQRAEGVRIKHRVNGNSIKLYDKQGSVLRIETTINQPREFKVFRPKEGDARGPLAWRPLRQGVADLHRRARVSQAANTRYAQALAAADCATPLGEQIERLTRHTALNGQRVRGLRPWGDDLTLLQAVNRGEFAINGVRNRDLRALLCEPAPSQAERRKQSARICRKLRLLRAHGVLGKVPHTHRYQLTASGRRIVTALLAAHAASTRELTRLAA